MSAATAEAPRLLRAEPSHTLTGEVNPPGDKSISHRALILGSLAEGETCITGLLEGDDVLATAGALRAFGIAINHVGPGRWLVRGGEWRSPPHPIDCGNSGTAARLLMGAAAGLPIEAEFDGDESLRSRPMGRVTEPLTAMGARFEGGDTLPLKLRGGALRGIRHLNERASAQVKSAILLAGLHADGPIEIIEPAPSRDHSEIMLRSFGCEVETQKAEGETRIVLGARRRLTATDVPVPGDPSSAAFPIVAALVTRGSEVTVRNVLLNPSRTGLFDVLTGMGADLQFSNLRHSGGELVGDVTACSSELRGIDVPARRAPSMIDEYPILAIAAACATGPTVMHGLEELRHKESDRLRAIVGGLTACGVAAVEEQDSLVVRPAGRPRGGGAVQSRGDHRIAMSFLILGLAAEQAVTVDRPEMIVTSFPAFVPTMSNLGARIAPEVPA